MLTEEFGMDPKSIELVFSGGRGYHVHVKDIAFRGWGSAERRELIDYVCGIGIDPALMLSGKLTGAARVAGTVPGRTHRLSAVDRDTVPGRSDGAPHRDGGDRQRNLPSTFPEKPGRAHHSDRERDPTGKILNDRVLSAVI